nr:AraC family transcriptional regulator [Collinsella urealyticum]
MNYRNPQHISIALYEAAQGISQCAGRDLEPGCTSVYTGNGSEFEAYCQRDSFTKAISITVSPEYYHDHLEPHFGTLDERRADLARADGRIDIPELASLYRHVRAYRGIGETADTFYRQAVVQAFKIVFAAASRIASHPSILSDEDAELIDSLRAYISANLESDLSCGTLATRAYIGQTKLKRLFKTRTGLAPNAYVTAQRMEHAEDLLSTTRLSIEEISERVGYRSAAAFSAAFRRAYGSSPSQIR